MSKFLGDVRTLSADARYMGVVFSGSMANALRQARKAPDHGLPIAHGNGKLSRSRFALLKHLNLIPRAKGNTLLPVQAIDRLLRAKILDAETPAPSIYSLEHALKQWPGNFLWPNKE